MTTGETHEHEEVPPDEYPGDRTHEHKALTFKLDETGDELFEVYDPEDPYDACIIVLLEDTVRIKR